MELSTIQRVIDNTSKGANIIVEWLRPVETLKSCDKAIDKHVRMVGRMGIEYDNMKDVKEKRENGELPATPQPIWHGAGQWVTYPWLIQHVAKKQLYVRLYNGTSTKVPVKVEWRMDGDAVPYETVLPYLTAKEKRDEREGDCFCCKIENIIRIGNEADWLNEVEETAEVAEVPATTSDVPVEQVPVTV